MLGPRNLLAGSAPAAAAAVAATADATTSMYAVIKQLKCKMAVPTTVELPVLGTSASAPIVQTQPQSQAQALTQAQALAERAAKRREKVGTGLGSGIGAGFHGGWVVGWVDRDRKMSWQACHRCLSHNRYPI